MYRTILNLLLAIAFVAATAPSGFACEPCDPCSDKPCICHNIGGPDDLGANCDMTGTCTYMLEGGQEIRVTPDHFLGIIIGFNQANSKAFAAHINHGDGPIEVEFDPPLHLASEIGPHRASNVECLGHRVFTQPDEPGN